MCEMIVDEVFENAFSIAESANEFEEIKRCVEGDAHER
jgi:hypothetical protein